MSPVKPPTWREGARIKIYKLNLMEHKHKTNGKKHEVNKIRIKVDNKIFTEEDFLKDCPNNIFIPTILPPVKRIIAIGDIHGDLKLAIKSFKLAGLIDDNFNWIADPPDTVVVQVGDQIDSCRPIPGVYNCQKNRDENDIADDVNVLNFFDEMNEKASKHGGMVYSLLGNHELMNSEGDLKYVSYDNYYNFSYKDSNGKVYEGPNGRKMAFRPGGPLAEHIACTRNSVLIIGSTLFVHAGVLPVLAERLEHLNLDSETKLRYLNAVVRKWLLHKLSQNENTYGKLLIDDPKISPFWTRIYGTIPVHTKIDTGKCFNSVKKTLEVFKIGHIVVGHTPQMYTTKNGINGTCYEKNDNKLYRIDGGFSMAFRIFGNQYMIQVLEILDDKIFNIITDTSIETTGTKYEAPDIGINEKYMGTISSIYSQNRTTSNKEHMNKIKRKKLRPNYFF